MLPAGHQKLHSHLRLYVDVAVLTEVTSAKLRAFLALEMLGLIAV